MKESKLHVKKASVLMAGLDKQSAFNIFEKFVKNNSILPEAIVCVNDSVALGVYDVCKKHEIIIPDDLGVIGFGHVKVSNLVQPPLSTVKLDLQQASIITVEKLVALINGKPYKNNNIIEGEIIFRESVK
jgi:DNA-binding LacI/PurR family transcriptional regulator